jgi:hypothetical protein
MMPCTILVSAHLVPARKLLTCFKVILHVHIRTAPCTYIYYISKLIPITGMLFASVRACQVMILSSIQALQTALACRGQHISVHRLHNLGIVDSMIAVKLHDRSTTVRGRPPGQVAVVYHANAKDLQFVQGNRHGAARLTSVQSRKYIS